MGSGIIATRAGSFPSTPISMAGYASSIRVSWSEMTATFLRVLGVKHLHLVESYTGIHEHFLQNIG